MKLQHVDGAGRQPSIDQRIVGIDEQADTNHGPRHTLTQRLQKVEGFDMARRARKSDEAHEARAGLDRGIERLRRRQSADLGLDGHSSLTPASRAIASAAARGS